ncbi:Ubiquinone biosynthesis O-methyltransferase [Candidatus Tiddalikarchaeum anstoanum]|nr:Ubiquinone biosynthesis O-methyltransferase [Candidatus Tiddalikarchaeum anstoanum]
MISVQDLYKKWASSYDTDINGVIYLEEEVTKKWFNFKNKTILDLGCGTGRYAIPLSNSNKVVGVDSSQSMLEIARKKIKNKNITFVNSDVTNYTPSQKFDVILSMLVYDHVKNLKKAIGVVKDASKRGTELFISNVHPYRAFLVSLNKNRARFPHGYESYQYYHPLDEYLHLLRPLGFELVDYKDLIFTKKMLTPKFKKAGEEENELVAVIYYFKKIN